MATNNPQTSQEPPAQMTTNSPQTSQEPLPEQAEMATTNPQTSQEPPPEQDLSGDNTESGPSTEAAVTEQDDSSNSNPLMILLDPNGVHGREQFRIMDPIGTAFNGSLQVYKAAYIADRGETYAAMSLRDVFVSVKYLSVNPETDASVNLRARIEKNALIPEHPNIMGTRNAFFYKGKMCVIFPFMDLGSMRSILTHKFRYGMLEGCTRGILRETLRGLSFIHSRGHVHKEISAGHIFLNGKPEIKLSFSASVFDLNEDQVMPSSSSSSSFLPAASICEWAAAPEIQESDNSEYTQAADIWSIGITALELAYGGLKVMNREALENLVAKINLKKKLPKRISKEGDWTRLDKLSCLTPIGPHFKNNRFSKEFESLVVKCLSLDPTKRPTADELLQDEIFTNLNMSVRFIAALVKD